MKRNNMLIEVDELLTKIGNPNLRIFDATILFFRKDAELTAFETYQQGHIPGAAFFDHKDFSDPESKYVYMVLAEKALSEAIGNAGISASSEVIIYTFDLLPCATRAWWLLRYAGHNNVRVLNGGLEAWKAAGGAIETGNNRYPETQFTPKLRPEMFVGKEEVKRVMDNGAVCTINTLTQQSFDQGHITGSDLSPCGDLMDEMSSFLATDVIAKRIADEAKHERVITYCGGGIAATVNGMAHLMAGNPNVAVYDGSMDEWTKDEMPITKIESKTS